MAKYIIATFTKWLQPNGKPYPYNLKKINEEDNCEGEALEKYMETVKPLNRIGVLKVIPD